MNLSDGLARTKVSRTSDANTAGGIGAFLTGFIMGSFQLMLFIYAGGVVLTTLIAIPNWPLFNPSYLKWLDPSESEKHPKPQVAALILKKKPVKK